MGQTKAGSTSRLSHIHKLIPNAQLPSLNPRTMLHLLPSVAAYTCYMAIEVSPPNLALFGCLPICPTPSLATSQAQPPQLLVTVPACMLTRHALPPPCSFHPALLSFAPIPTLAAAVACQTKSLVGLREM
jgi:hypothetical protein